MVRYSFLLRKKLWILAGLGYVLLYACQKQPSKQAEEGLSNDQSYQKLSASAIHPILDYKEQAFPDTKEGRLAKKGEQIIAQTGAYLNQQGQYNNLSCTHCHLDKGTKAYAAPFIGLSNLFPMYRGREDRMGSLQDRINGCLERSLNGVPIEKDSPEMKAMVAYINHLSPMENKERIEGQGFVSLQTPKRRALPDKGKQVYQQYCVMCHQSNGEGLKEPGTEQYLYPPLWGSDSFNDGAGMHRVLMAARFIKGNMPLGVSYDAPQLTDKEAYDVAAYINSFPRPEKANKEKDYPDLTKKPVDTPYGPYADQVPQSQHQFGPFNF